jgi:CBS domain containing-hemolysin-like protein
MLFLAAVLVEQTAWWIVAIAMIFGAFGLFCLEWGISSLVGRDPEKWAQCFAPFVGALRIVLYPLTALPLALSQGQRRDQELSNLVSEAELMSMVDASHKEGVLEGDEREMIYSIFHFGDTLAREIMVPRIYITALDVELSIKQAVEALLESGHSRLPVYEDTIDHILGLLYARDLLHLWQEGAEGKSLREVLRPAFFVPEAKKVDELMAEMQAQRFHMAMVVDEYGGIAGLVTLEDIVEEIVGEIQDEYDQSEELPYQVVDESTYIFQGRIGLDDFNELMDSRLPVDEADTLGGFIYGQIGRVPASGESLQVEGLLLTVEQVTGRRIRKVRAQKVHIPQEEKSDNGAGG